MKTDKIYIETESSLNHEISSFINKIPKEYELFICGGHFPLYYSLIENKVIPGIYQEINNHKSQVDVLNFFGGFPLYTWELACYFSKLGLSKHLNSKLILLINDWQEIPPVENVDPSLPNPFRNNFYKSFKDLPNSYKYVFNKHSLNFSEQMFKIEKNRFYLRELHLRDRFKRVYKKKFGTELDMSSCSYSEGNYLFHDEIVISQGNPGCAGEIAQMILELLGQTKKVALINFLPLCCEEKVNLGTTMIYELFKLNPIVQNVFLCTKGTIKNEDFYQKKQENKNPIIYNFGL
jgi:hypothetical protein